MVINMLTCFWCLVIVLTARGSATVKPVVKTSLGTISGYHRLSFYGRKFSAFEGIPYAKPPVGHLRFEEPVPIEPWIGIWNASYHHKCIQMHFFEDFSKDLHGTEDCLYLNVFVPRLTPNPEERLDVLAYIHGGGFRFHSGLTYAQPHYVMDKEVIFVSFNYRIGIFGFLSTEDEVIPGNMGLKDQTLALKWIQNHIHNFGGNAKSVTIFGMSAGGVSVQLHYLAPMSKGLFHRGFSMSGNAVNGAVVQNGALKQAKILSSAVGCPDTTSRIMVDCLKSRPATELWKNLPRYLKYKYIPTLPFTPVVETKSTNPFITDYPYNLLQRGYVADVPWILSITSGEDRSSIDEDEDLLYYLNNWNYIMPYTVQFSNSVDEKLWNVTSQKILDYYLGNDRNFSKTTKEKLIRAYAEKAFYGDVDTASWLQTRRNKSPVYVLMIDYPRHQQEYLMHADDGPYYFYRMDGSGEPTAEELKMTKVLYDMLVAYAKTGKPDVGVPWLPTSSDKLSYLKMSGYTTDKMMMEAIDKIPASKDFWKSLGLRENENLNNYKDEM